MTNKLLPDGNNEAVGVAVELNHASAKDEKAVEKDSKYYDDYIMTWTPYDGATSFSEIDGRQEALDYSYEVDELTSQLRGIIQNVTNNENLSADEKAQAISGAADEYRKRVNNVSKGNKSLLSRILGSDKRRKKWPYHDKKDDEEEDDDDDESEDKKEVDIRELPAVGGFKVYKDKEGNYRWLTFSSNAYQDLDGELFTTKALNEAVEYADKSGERGPLLVFHVPSAEIGQCDFQAVEGRFLIESGTFDDTPLGRKAVEHFVNTDEEYQVSIGYMHYDGDEKDGVYDWLQIMERSVLPKGDAANPWTDFKVIGGKEVDKRHADALVSIFGEELSARVISEADEKTKELDGKVKFKEVKVTIGEDDKPQISVVMEDDSEGEAPKEESKEEPKEVPVEKPSEDTKEDGGLVELAGVVSKLAGMVETLTVEVKALKESDDVKISSIITPRALNGHRPTESKDNLLDPEAVKQLSRDEKEEQPKNPALPYVLDAIGIKE